MIEPIPCEPGEGVPGDMRAVSELVLCDENGTFIRRTVLDGNGDVVSIIDVAMDGITPYTPVGAIGDCSETPPDPPEPPCEDGERVLVLCDTLPDGTVVQFLRWMTYDAETGHVIEEHDTELDGETPYTPVGEIGDCEECHGGSAPEPCVPEPMCPRLVGISGPDVWEMPAGTESVSLSVVCGPVTVTDCSGSATVIRECSTTFSWSAPGTSCHSGELCAPFTVDLPEGSAAYINFLEPCDQGDES